MRRQRELTRILLRLSPEERQTLAGSLPRLVDVAADGYGTAAAHRLPL